MLLNASRIIQETHQEQLILLAINDITETATLQRNVKERLEKAVREGTRELGEANEALLEKNKELERTNKELESFAYISSHDLQEPLRKIQTFSSRILETEDQNLSVKGKDYFHRMQEAAKRMQVLIEDLLLYSRTGTIERKFEKTDFTVIVEEVKAELKEAIQEKKATIQLTESCEMLVIPFLFRQLLHNMISNALKFSKPGVPPIIVIKSSIKTGLQLKQEKLSPEKEYCHITVSDNGIGFEPEYQERIFELFQRLHDRSEYIGTGIGLAIVKKIVENHQGIITATSKLGKGARFDIYFPAM